MHPHTVNRSSEPRAQTSLRNWTSPPLDPIHPAPQPFLPSIRQLHPELPPSGLSHQLLASGSQGSSQIFSSPPHFTLPPSQPGPSILGTRRASEAFDAPGEVDDAEPAVTPPKKKRRRQALSCTECKRRKIKCDRAHPCAQCTRRGEQARCQWHIIEPIEKYVTRAEYEDLKARFNELSEQVQRLQRLVNIPQMDGQPALSGTSEAVPTSSGSGPVAYPPLMPHASVSNPDTPYQGLATPLVNGHPASQEQPHRPQYPPLPISGSPLSSANNTSTTRRSSLHETSPPPPPVTKNSTYSLATIMSPPSTGHTPPSGKSSIRTPLGGSSDAQRPRSRQPQPLAGQVAH